MVKRVPLLQTCRCVFFESPLGPWIPNKVHGWTCGTEEGKLPMSWRGICAHPLIWWKHCVISNMSSHLNHGLWTKKVIMYCQVCIRYFFCMVCRSLHVTSLAWDFTWIETACNCVAPRSNSEMASKSLTPKAPFSYNRVGLECKLQWFEMGWWAFFG